MNLTLKNFARSAMLVIPFVFTAQAQAWHHEEAQAAAHELANATEHVHQQAELERHHFTWREEQALLALHTLAEAAEHLHAKVESYWQDPSHTFQDYQQVALAMQHARWSLRAGHFPEHTLDDWFRAENAFQRLQYEYAGGGGYDGGHGGGYPYPGHGG